MKRVLMVCGLLASFSALGGCYYPVYAPGYGPGYYRDGGHHHGHGRGWDGPRRGGRW